MNDDVAGDRHEFKGDQEKHIRPHNNATDVATRRRLLLSGIVKGSAVVASAIPIKSLAYTSSITADGLICTISGVQSAAHSQSTALRTCGGFSPGKYKKIENWPNYQAFACQASPKSGKKKDVGTTCETGTASNTVGNKTFTQDTSFYEIFGGGSSNSLISLMKNNAGFVTEFHYIAALLNAIQAPAGYVFPYSAEEVVALYAGPQQSIALGFFQDFMETV